MTRCPCHQHHSMWCPPCCSLMKCGHWAEKVALTQIYWRIVAVKWLHSDVGVSFGSFLSGLKDECPPRQAVHSRLPLLQCGRGCGNCHPWLWLDVARSNFFAPGIFLQLDSAFRAASTSLFLIFMICKLLVTWPLPPVRGNGRCVLLGSGPPPCTRGDKIFV